MVTYLNLPAARGFACCPHVCVGSLQASKVMHLGRGELIITFKLTLDENVSVNACLSDWMDFREIKRCLYFGAGVINPGLQGSPLPTQF